MREDLIVSLRPGLDGRTGILLRQELFDGKCRDDIENDAGALLQKVGVFQDGRSPLRKVRVEVQELPEARVVGRDGQFVMGQDALIERVVQLVL